MPVARRLSSVLGSSTLLSSVVSRFLARVNKSEKMATTPSQPAAKQLQSLLDTGKGHVKSKVKPSTCIAPCMVYKPL